MDDWLRTGRSMSLGTSAQSTRDGDLDPFMIVAVVGVGFVFLILGYVVSVLLWFAGQLSGLIWNGDWPKASPKLDILLELFSHPGNPAAGWPEAAQSDVGPAWLLYPFFIVFLVPVGFVMFLTVRQAIRFRRHREFRHMRLGFADGGEVARLLGARAVKKKAKSVRPSYKGKKRFDPLEVGYFLGRDKRSRRKLYCSVEDVMMVVAPPRQGKDVHFCIPNIIDAMGACIATSTRADMFAATVSLREKVGQVWVFDPNKMTNWPSQMRWSPVNGCEDPLIALNRAAAFVAGAGVGEGVQNASYWSGVATAILRCYLHAASLSGRTITDVVRWSTQPTNPEPIQILRAMEIEGKSAQGWAGELESSAATDGEARGNMWAGVRRALDCFADPHVLASCSPGPEDVFDMPQFLGGRNTLYILGKEKKNGSVAPLVTALMEDMFDHARKIATKMPNSRMDPPLTVELNEAAHIAPLPNLPSYMGDSGGFSIALHVYLQSLAQARSKWSQDEAAVMWDTSAIRIVMGGSGHVNDLEDISRLLGEVDEKTRSVTKGVGGRSVSYSKQKRRVMAIDELRTLEFGRAVVIARAARPVESMLTPWWKRKDSKEIEKGIERANKVIISDGRDIGDIAATIATPLALSLGQHPLELGPDGRPRTPLGAAGPAGPVSPRSPESASTDSTPGALSTPASPLSQTHEANVMGAQQSAPPGRIYSSNPAESPVVGHPVSSMPDEALRSTPPISGMPVFDPISGQPVSGSYAADYMVSGAPASAQPSSAQPNENGAPISSLPSSAPLGPFPPAMLGGNNSQSPPATLGGSTDASGATHPNGSAQNPPIDPATGKPFGPPPGVDPAAYYAAYGVPQEQQPPNFEPAPPGSPLPSSQSTSSYESAAQSDHSSQYQPFAGQKPAEQNYVPAPQTENSETEEPKTRAAASGWGGRKKRDED